MTSLIVIYYEFTKYTFSDFSFTFIMRIKIKLLVADRREQTKIIFPLPLNLLRFVVFICIQYEVKFTMGLTSKLEKLKLKELTGHEAAVKSNVVNGADTDDTDDIDEMDNEGQSILMGIIAQLRPGMDLSRITLPTFILEKKSMLENYQFFQIQTCC